MAQYQQFDPEEYPSPKSDFHHNMPKVHCAICGDTGVVFDKDGQPHPCRCWQKQQLERRQKNANLPKALRLMTFDNFDLSYYPANERPDLNANLQFSYLDFAKKAKKAAETFAQNIIAGIPAAEQEGLLLQGQVGSGKTHLAAAIANVLIQHQQEVLFLVVPNFLDEMRMSYGNNGEFNESQLMNRAQNAEVLILDDLGAHNFSDWTKNKLFTLINYRINQCLPMIITTNLQLDDLCDILGERIISRIIAGCKPCLLPVKQDIRLSRLKR